MADNKERRSPAENVELADGMLTEFVGQHSRIGGGGKSKVSFHVGDGGWLEAVHIEDALNLELDAAREFAKSLVKSRNKAGNRGRIEIEVDYDSNGQPMEVLLRELSIL